MRKFLICDTHNDFLTELPLGEIKPYMERCKESGVDVLCSSYWSTRRDEDKIREELLERAELLNSFDRNFFLHIEDLWWVKNEDALRFLLGLKPFSCSLTWNDENCLAGGTNAECGLTDWGKHCLELLLENGIAVDVAHLNRKSFWETVKLLKGKVYCSHTGFYGVKRHRRNLTDKQLDYIVRSGGFVGLFFFDKCVQIETKNKKETRLHFGVDDIVKNLLYFTKHWGFDNIGFGTDFYGIDTYPLGLVDYADFGKLVDAMKNAGFSENQIDKIFYSNFKDFLERC